MMNGRKTFKASPRMGFLIDEMSLVVCRRPYRPRTDNCERGQRISMKMKLTANKEAEDCIY